MAATMIEQWDLYVRFITIGASILLLIVFATGNVRRKIKVALIGLICGLIGYLLNSTPLVNRENPLDPWVDLISLFTTFWVWMFARRLFESEPPFWAIVGAVVALVVPWFFGNFFLGPQLIAFYIIHAISLVMIVDLIRVAWRDRDDDLIQKRRIIRLVLPLLVAAQTGGILIYEIITVTELAYPPAQLANVMVILVLTLFSGVLLLNTDPELLVETTNDPQRAATMANDLSPAELVLYEKLNAAMEAGYYREPGLTIASLAAHLDTPEHRLRSLINQRLGHRNFSAFLNRHRIAEAKQKLGNRDDVDLPVLTIAMDLGYNSLPTFNRAFRSETGTTPSEFRRLAINGSDGQN